MNSNESLILKRIEEWKSVKDAVFQLSPEDAHKVKVRVLDRYVDPYEHPSGIVNFVEDQKTMNLHNVGISPLLLMTDYLADKQDLILFFDRKPGGTVLRFSDGLVLARVLNHEPIYPEAFFISNQSADFLFYHSQERWVHVLGDAIGWLDRVYSEVWQRIGLPEGNLQATNVQVKRWGNDIVLDCIYEHEAERQTLQLVFVDCTIQRWYPKWQMQGKEYQEGEITPVYRILLGRKFEDHPSIPATITSERFSVVFFYGDLFIYEKAAVKQYSQ